MSDIKKEKQEQFYLMTHILKKNKEMRDAEDKV